MLLSIASFFLQFSNLFGGNIAYIPPVVPAPSPAIIITVPTIKPTPTPTLKPVVTPTPKPVVVKTPAPVQNNSVTAQSLFSALNNYRAKNGKAALAWDDKLGNYAQTRADHFRAIGNIDNHAGFNDFIQNQNGFAALGFNSLGENSSFGGTTSAQDVIEKVYAVSAMHNQNMLSTDWSDVGVGIAGIYTDFVFGGKKR